ncbi:hypothetical protein HHI36_020532 [Cryptolaemus montrouzieri]|uniref:Attacin C-terminal domain-containing protein n=1 Tax=Cryptolaemus montrouzieri TaxID=559131 RepID=A0ABD2NB66_9CUCU
MNSKLSIILTIVVMFAYANVQAASVPVQSIALNHTQDIPPNSPIHRIVRDTDWKVEPTISRDAVGNTAGSVRVERKFGDHEVHAGASKVFEGPGRGGPSFHVGGTFNW